MRITRAAWLIVAMTLGGCHELVSYQPEPAKPADAGPDADVAVDLTPADVEIEADVIEADVAPLDLLIDQPAACFGGSLQTSPWSFLDDQKLVGNWIPAPTGLLADPVGVMGYAGILHELGFLSQLLGFTVQTRLIAQPSDPSAISGIRGPGIMLSDQRIPTGPADGRWCAIYWIVDHWELRLGWCQKDLADCNMDASELIPSFDPTSSAQLTLRVQGDAIGCEVRAGQILLSEIPPTTVTGHSSLPSLDHVVLYVYKMPTLFEEVWLCQTE